MNVASDSSPRFLGLSPAAAAILVIALTTAVRFFYSVWLPLLPRRSLLLPVGAASRRQLLQQGPAVAYTVAAGTSLFGANNFGVRFFAVMLFRRNRLAGVSPRAALVR